MSLLGHRYADGQTLDVGGCVVRLRVSGRARRISLRVDALRGEAIAVAPSARRLADAVAFARTRRDWIVDRLAQAAQTQAAMAPSPLAPGAALAVFGAPWVLRPDGRRPSLVHIPGESGRVLRGCGAGEVDPQLVTRAVRREAAAVFTRRAAVHCAALGVAMPPLSLTDARTRWGSCTPAQAGRGAAIRLSWRLALAPMAVADYVVAHECAHLLEANHGPRFWALVRILVGDEKHHRAWLRAEGTRLHAILPKG